MAGPAPPPAEGSASFLDERAPASGPARVLLLVSFVAGSFALIGMLALDFVAVICFLLFYYGVRTGLVAEDAQVNKNSLGPDRKSVV